MEATTSYLEVIWKGTWSKVSYKFFMESCNDEVTSRFTPNTFWSTTEEVSWLQIKNLKLKFKFSDEKGQANFSGVTSDGAKRMNEVFPSLFEN